MVGGSWFDQVESKYHLSLTPHHQEAMMLTLSLLTAAVVAIAALYAMPTEIVAQTGSFVPVTPGMQAHPDPSDWLHISRTYDEHRFSPLKQINKSNVAQLRMAWSRGLPVGTQESTPIVYRGVMYVIAPGASVQALDATNGDLLLGISSRLSRGVQPRAARSKNLGIYEDMIYFGAPDGFLVALDAQTGKLRWETKVDEGQITAGGLLVADGKVISNRTCDRGSGVLFHRRA